MDFLLYESNLVFLEFLCGRWKRFSDEIERFKLNKKSVKKIYMYIGEKYSNLPF